MTPFLSGKPRGVSFGAGTTSKRDQALIALHIDTSPLHRALVNGCLRLCRYAVLGTIPVAAET